MKTLFPALAILALGASTYAADNAKQPVGDTVFREPFTLILHIDKEHYHKQEIGKVPYVHNGDVYIFKGDEFGLALNVQDNSIASVKYQSDTKKADVTLKFTQEVQRDGTTLVRFDPVYVGHFKCNRQRIADYPNLSNYTRDLYQVPGVAETVSLEHIKRHYHGSHETINPTRVVPKGPDIDYAAAHDRGRFAARPTGTAA